MKRILATALALVIGSTTMADWTFTAGSGTAGTITDGVWTFDVVVLEDGLRITDVNTAGPTDSIIDFTQPFTDGHAIVEVGTYNPFRGKSNDGTFAAGILLPATLKRVDGDGFRDCKIPITLPEVNSLEVIGSWAFAGSGLCGKVVLNGGLYSPDNGLLNSQVSELVYGQGIHWPYVSGSFAIGSLTATLRKLTVLDDDFTFGDRSYNKHSLLSDFEFAGYPTFVKNWSGGTKQTDCRVWIPRYNADWQRLLNADYTDWKPWPGQKKFVTWENCPDETKAEYTDVFGTDGGMPAGRISELPYAGYPFWVFYRAEPDSTGATVKIVGNPDKYGTVTPGYDTVYGVQTGDSFTASQYAEVGDVLYGCTGWTLEMWDTGNADYWTVVTNAGTRSYNYDRATDAHARLTWLWTPAAYHVDASSPLDGTSIITNNAADLRGFYSVGATASFTAVGDDFVRWTGVPECIDATQRTISFTVDGAYKPIPYFRRNWVYHQSGKTLTLTDGYWTFNVGVDNGNEITLKSFRTMSDIPLVDLDKPVSDGYSIIQVGVNNGYMFNAEPFNNRSGEIILPSTMKVIAPWAFSRVKSNITLPEHNSLTNLGNSAFYMANLTGRIVLKNLKNSLLYGEDIRNTLITAVEFGENPPYLQRLSFQANPNLTEIVMPVKAEAEDGWNSGNVAANTRYLVRPDDTGWAAVIADTSTFTPRRDCTDLNSYYEKFGADAIRPLGYSTAKPFPGWICPLSDKTMVIIVK